MTGSKRTCPLDNDLWLSSHLDCWRLSSKSLQVEDFRFSGDIEDDLEVIEDNKTYKV